MDRVPSTHLRPRDLLIEAPVVRSGEVMAALRSIERSSAAKTVAVVAAYVALAAWGEQLALSDTLTLSYPPPGLAVAAVAIGGRRFVIPTMVAELIVSVVVFDVATGFGVGFTLLNALLVGGSYGLVGLALHRTVPRHPLTDLRGMTLLGVQLVLGAVPGAAAGTTLLRLSDQLTTDHLDAAITWFQGDVLGMLAVAPAVLLGVKLRSHDDRLVPQPPLRSWLGALEISSVIAVPVVTVAFVDRVDLLYLCLVPVVFVAMRRAHPGSAIAAAATAGALTTTLAVAQERFSRADVTGLLVVIAVTGAVMGIVVAQRFRSVGTNERLTAALERTDDLVVLATLSGHPRWWNRAASTFLLRDGDRTPLPVHEALVGGLDRSAQLAGHVAEGRVWEGEQVLLDADGGEHPVSMALIPDVDAHEGVVGYTIIARDITARHAYEAELTRRALYDELTGIPNRALLTERLDHARHRRIDRQAALMVLDVDRFKVVNDSLGHASGDELLRAMTARLQNQMRPTDTLARMGGDEFAILAEDLDGLRAIITVAERVLDCLRDPFELSTGTVVATVSLGVVRLEPAETGAELLRRADLAMYRAKANGGGRYALYDDRMTRTADRRLQLESSLRRSLLDRDIELHYQPVVDLHTGSIVFAEALLRMTFPDLGPVHPPEVVGIARETGLLGELGGAVLHTAAAEAASWPDVAVSVNISPHQLRDDDLLRSIEQTLRATTLDPSQLIVEITEEAFLDDPGLAATVLHRVRRLGIRIALDDFGTGFSSLATLRTLPIDILKLDQQMLGDLGESPQARAIVGAVLGVAEVLEVIVVAEGVETDSQLEISRSLGCQLGQGHRIGRPAPATDLGAWFTSHTR